MRAIRTKDWVLFRVIVTSMRVKPLSHLVETGTVKIGKWLQYALAPWLGCGPKTVRFLTSHIASDGLKGLFHLAKTESS